MDFFQAIYQSTIWYDEGHIELELEYTSCTHTHIPYTYTRNDKLCAKISVLNEPLWARDASSK